MYFRWFKESNADSALCTGEQCDWKLILAANRHLSDERGGGRVAPPGTSWQFAQGREQKQHPIEPSPPLPSLPANLALEDVILDEDSA